MLDRRQLTKKGENRMNHKKNVFKPVLLIHSPFLLPSFFYEGIKNGERITSFRTFSNLIDF